MGSNRITGPLGVAQSGHSAGFGSRRSSVQIRPSRPRDHGEWASSKATCFGYRRSRVRVPPSRPSRPVSSAARAEIASEPWEEWLQATREELKLIVTGALSAVSQQSSAIGEHKEAVDAGRRLVVLEP